MIGVIRTLKDWYGFIAGDDDVDYFFLASALDRMAAVTFEQLGEGDAVTFTPIDHPKGPRAIEVIVTSREVTLFDARIREPKPED